MIYCLSAPLRRSQQSTTLTRHRKLPIENRSCAGLWTITILSYAYKKLQARGLKLRVDREAGNRAIFIFDLKCGTEKQNLIQSFAQFRTFAQFRIIQIEEYLILLNDGAGEFKLLSEKVHSLTDIFI